MIPKILHQSSKHWTWEEKRVARRAKQLMPDFEHKAWTNEINAQMVHDLFPEFVEDFLSIPDGVIRVDIARCLYMHHFGGIYFDTDYVFYKPVGADILEKKCVLAVEDRNCPSINGIDKFGNAFIASEPGFPLWLEFVNHIFERYKAGHRKVVFLSGPHALSVYLHEHPSYMNDITVLPQERVYPEFTRLKLAGKKTDDTLGAHLCWGSWRNKPVMQQVRNRTRRIISAVV